MSVMLPTFTPLDNRRSDPILGDATADEIVRATDYDYGQLHVDTNLVLSASLRAKKLDQVASALLARHPDAVGLDLGAGLDTRSERLAPPATVDWYDVDFPAVVAARKDLIPERPNVHVIGADARDPAARSSSTATPVSPSGSRSTRRSGAGSTGWRRTAPPWPGWQPSSCTTASDESTP